jgi:hypothetical protein
MEKVVRSRLAELEINPKCNNCMTSGVHLQKGMRNPGYRTGGFEICVYKQILSN